VTGLVAGTAAAVMRGGRIAIQQVATDAFGNALGSSLADAMKPSDPMGDFINEKVAEQDLRDRYGFGSVAGGLGLKSSVSDWDNAQRQPQANWSMADWKQQQVAQLVQAGRHSEAADLNAADVRMMDSGPHNFDDEPVAGDVLAKGPSNPQLTRIVEGALTKLPAPPGGLGGLRWLGGPLVVGFELATFMKNPSTTDWRAGGSSFSYNQDDFTLRIKDSETGTGLAVPGIHNPSQHSDAQYLAYVSYKANGGELNINDYVSFDPPEMGSVDRASSQKPEWLRRLDAGNAFNKERSVAYPYNEVYVNKASGDGYYRLDSYNDRAGEIVSRKFTQFSEITERTGIDYVNEMAAKYPVGATIANVPTNIKNGLAGDLLIGRHILEVPVQVRPIPQAVIDTANRAGVLIRDINGKVH
jgi:hypothetical protein